MSRSRAYTRHQRINHIGRKKRIIHNQNDYRYYKHEGMLSKGKIHCSCWMCRTKSYNYPKIQDVRRCMAMDYSEKTA
ncbi:MAG: hypothetical protein IJ555_14985 [Ruminococcus sp.]|nr:hypothetical protein [Ruminococcus sp.]